MAAACGRRGAARRMAWHGAWAGLMSDGGGLWQARRGAWPGMARGQGDAVHCAMWAVHCAMMWSAMVEILFMSRNCRGFPAGPSTTPLCPQRTHHSALSRTVARDAGCSGSRGPAALSCPAARLVTSSAAQQPSDGAPCSRACSSSSRRSRRHRSTTAGATPPTNPWQQCRRELHPTSITRHPSCWAHRASTRAQ
jgi:hypothetical protein